MPTRLTRERGGYSLVELLVTIFIAGIVFSAMVPLFVGAQGRNSADTRRNVCIAVARDRIEKIRLLDYKEITQANLESATFKGGQFGTVYHNLIAPGARSDVFVDYTVTLVPNGAIAGTEQYKIVTVGTTWDDPSTAAVEPPRPAYRTVLRTEIYKQYAGPQIQEFHVLQNGAYVESEITAAQVTLRAVINSADVASMDQANPDVGKRGRVQVSVFNSAGTLITRQDVSTPVGGEPTRYEWVWTTAAAADGQYNFRAVAYSGDGFQGNTWQLTYILEKGAPPAPTVTAEAGNATVSLSWVTNPPATDLDHYEVWRSIGDENGAYVQIVPSTTSTSHVDMGLTNGETYWYKVAAFDKRLNSSYSAPVSAMPELPVADTTGPTAPTGLSAAKGGPNVATIILTWTTGSVDNPPPTHPSGMAPNGKYVVQRAANAAFTTGVTTLSAAYPYGASAPGNLTFTDASTGYSATWYYRIAGVDNDGNQGPWSTVVSATTDGPVMRSLTVTRSGGKYYVWVQSKVPPFLWYTTSGASSATRPAGVYGNKNSSSVFTPLPSGLYTIIYSLASSGTPQTGAKDADLTAGNAVVSI